MSVREIPRTLLIRLILSADLQPGGFEINSILFEDGGFTHDPAAALMF